MKTFFTVLALATATHAAPVLIAPTTPFEPVVDQVERVVSSPDGLVARTLRRPDIQDTIWVQASTDRGRTWQAPFEVGVLDGSYDGVLSVAGTNLVDYFGPGWFRGVQVRSTDGGTTFTTTPVPETLVVRDLVTSRTGTVARIEQLSSPQEGRVTTSTDHGLSWRVTRLEDAQTAAWTDDDDLLVCWREGYDPAALTRCRRSRNGGLDFAPAVTVSLPSTTMTWILRLASGGPGEAFLLAGHSLGHTTDGGDTWSAVDLGSSINWRRIATRGNEAWILGDGALRRTTDGATFEDVPLPVDTWNGCAVQDLAVINPGAVLLAPLFHRTEDAGRSWSEPERQSIVTEFVVDDVEVVRLRGGRLVAIWSSVVGTNAPIRSSFSDDGGLTWSPESVVLNDQLRMSLGFEGFAATLTPSDELVILWQTMNRELRVTTTHNGALTWSPSALVVAKRPVGCVDPLPFSEVSIVSDGSSRLLVSWLDGYGIPNGFAHMARSSDGGITWSPDEPIAFNAKGLIPPVRTADGDLVVGLRTFEEWNAFGRSSDGGASWNFEILSPTSSAWAPARFLATATRLFAAEFERCGIGCVNQNLESRDGGHTWTGARTFLHGLFLLAGDEAGYAYWRPSRYHWLPLETNALIVAQPRGSAIEYPKTGDWPFSPIAAVARAPLELGVVRAIDEPAADTPVAGIYYDALAPGTHRVRRDSIASLVPRPDIASRFPLPFADLDATSPWVDGGSATSEDVLVLYQVETAGSAILKIAKEPARQPHAVRLIW